MGARKALAIVGLGLCFLGLGCAQEQDEEVLETKDAFVQRGWDWLRNQSIIEPAMKGPVKVKVETDHPFTKQWVTLFENAMNTWFDEVRDLPGGRELTRQVIIVQRDEDITLKIRRGRGRAYYSTGSMILKQSIELFEDDGEEALLHEMGHAIGLGDGYVEGKWNCKPGQPDSLMCHSDWTELHADDIRGVRYEFCQRTKRCDENRYKDTYGGGGGTPFAATCPPGAHLSALEVRRGWVVDSVTPICEDEKSGARTRLGRIGGGGGEDTELLSCERGAWITQISVDHQNWVTGLRANCSNGRILSNTMGSGSHDTYACPDSHSKAVGLRGGSGSWIDHLGLSCERP